MRADLLAHGDAHLLSKKDERRIAAALNASGCTHKQPLLGWRPDAGPRCRLCDAVARYVVEETEHDAARPFGVVRTFRKFNRVVRWYETEAQASRRCRDLNKKHRGD